jgi:hypothetical protein
MGEASVDMTWRPHAWDCLCKLSEMIQSTLTLNSHIVKKLVRVKSQELRVNKLRR